MPLAKMGSLETFCANKTAICTTSLRPCTKNNRKRDAQLMMISYQEAREADADLQSLDNALKTRTTAVINALADDGLSTRFLKQVTDYVRYLSQESSGAVLGRRNAFGSMNLNSSNEESFKLLVDEYMNNSLQMLNFCSELDRFLKQARNTHSYIEYVTRECFEKETAMGTSQYKMTSKRLKNLRASEDVSGQYSSAGRLLEKVVCLRRQQEQMLEKLKVQNEKLGKKESRARSWRKLTMMLFIMAVVGLLISIIVTAALAIPSVAPALGAAIVPMLAGGDWITNWFGKYETAFKDQQEENVAMQAGARVSIKELGDIKFLIDRVVNEIDSLLFAPNSTIEEQIDFTMKDIKLKLETFMREIETLQEEANKCTSEIRKARDKVVNNIKFLNKK
ncbi:unnamed protein product [Prunus armeniaca]|uniref:Uncharacterized protein n=1 Tax=Prunus armeniaca TaxID=36596 RepID=A0A6J5VPQ3_PRUAR|nr:unnamed protein product [Prunus armeniaca]